MGGLRQSHGGGGFGIALARILLAGLAIPGSGLTRVLTALARSLSPSHVLSYFCLDNPRAAPPGLRGVSFYPCPFGPANPSAPEFFLSVITEAHPDLVFLMGQPVWLAPLLRALQTFRGSLRIALYAPLEGNVVNPAAIRPLLLVDDCILYTQYARNSVLSLIAAVQKEEPQFRSPALHVLPHGVDTEVFYPLSESRADIRRRLFPARPELHDAFIVLNANVPYPRKRIDLTLQAFAQFARNKPKNVFLYLHGVRADKRLWEPLRQCMRSSGIEDRTLINLMNPNGETISESALNDLYNACNVGINTAMGEGWGLVNFEHAATGAAQVLPNHSTFIENWSGAAELVEIKGQEYCSHEHTDMYVVSPEDAAHKLELLYNDPVRYRNGAKAAYARATARAYQWNDIVTRLEKILAHSLMKRA